MSSDQNFPHIVFNSDQGPQERGHQHGESFASPIKELSSIRKELMLTKSPHLSSRLSELAKEQYQITKKIFPQEWEELDAIRFSSNTSIEDIVILNNYTDFRDINLPEQGCTTIGIDRDEKVSGQTWDMHSSAKNYVSTMELPGHWQVFSLVGCIGMMGVNNNGLFVGVNNLNTLKATPGVIWPALIRSLLTTTELCVLRERLVTTPVTSGHNYLISNGQQWENWEVGANFQKMANQVTKDLPYIYHTNHCLHQEAIDQEEPLSQNSTSQNRFELIAKKAEALRTTTDVVKVLQDHDGYPKSICSHFQSNAVDPSTTCGGAVFNHKSKEFKVWRCCPKDPEKYISRTLIL